MYTLEKINSNCKKRIVISNVASISPFGENIMTIFNTSILEKKHQLIERFTSIQNFNFFNYHYKIKTKIDICSQICIHIVAQLLQNSQICDNSMIGLITASKNGCSISKAKYLKQLNTFEDPQYASPKDFVQSICNIPNSQAAIEFNIKGITNHYVGSSDASLTSIWQAMKCLKDGIADTMLVGTFDVFSEQQKQFLSTSNLPEIKYSEAAAGIKIQLQDNVNQNDLYFEILGIGFGSSTEIGKALKIALTNAIKESNIDTKEITFIISNSNSSDEFYKNELTSFDNVFNRPIPTLLLKSYTGECLAPFPLLAIAISSRLAGYFLPNNLFTLSNDNCSKYLVYENIMIKKGNIALILGYSDFANAVVICVKY